MKSLRNLLNLIWLPVVLLVLITSCKKEDEGEQLPSSEPINFIAPDTTIVFAQPGTTFDFDVYLVIDRPIDTFRLGYQIDTLMRTTPLPFSQVDTVVYTTGFDEVNNKQRVTASFVLPDSIPGVRAFREYQPEVATPVFIPATYDALRVVMRIEAPDRVFEKNLKIIFE
jgi:hypothetical protein